MRYLALILIITLLILIKNNWFNEEHGTQKIEALEQKLAETQKLNEELRLKNSEIQAEIDGIKYSEEAQEELARKHLGLIKKDETFFHITPAPNQNSTD